MKSILQNDNEVCYLCKKYGATDTHHVCNGTANRKKSEEDGLKIRVHRVCHNFIHTHELTDLNLKAKAQRIWKDYYNKTDTDFIDRYGINYIEKYYERTNKNEKNSNKWN